MRFIYILFVLIFIGCATSKKAKYERYTLKITNIEEYDKVFGMDAINTKTNEKIFIISNKQSSCGETNFKKKILNFPVPISKGKIYNFRLKPIRPRVGKFQGLGAYIIIENDTFKRAESYKKLPLSFVSESSIGLLVSN